MEPILLAQSSESVYDGIKSKYKSADAKKLIPSVHSSPTTTTRLLVTGLTVNPGIS